MVTLEQKAREIVALWESKLGQSIPISDRSFLWQLALTLASFSVSVDKKADLEVRENLAITATRAGVTEIGRNELGRDPYAATQAKVTAEFFVADGVVIPVGTTFLAEQNNLTYTSVGTVIGTISGVADIDMKSDLSGASTTLEIASVVLLQGTIAGVSATGAITDVIELGLSEEGTEEYRSKVLDAIRAQGGGSNAWDYRLWAQEVQGVERAYPYGGQFTLAGDQIGGPSSRTVFIQASDSIDPDGIAPQQLIDEVREKIITDPATNRNRICLGVPDATLFIQSIRRVEFDVKVYGTSASWNGDVQIALTEALENYFFRLIPYVDGVDSVAGRTNIITPVNVSNVVYDVLIQYGVSASKVEVFLAGETAEIDSYELPAGALAKTNSITYL